MCEISSLCPMYSIRFDDQIEIIMGNKPDYSFVLIDILLGENLSCQHHY